MNNRYRKFTETVHGLSLVFSTSYMVEAGFTHLNALLTKQQNRLDVGERGDIRLKIINLSPMFLNLTRAMINGSTTI